MIRDIVKVRKVGGTIVVTLTQALLGSLDIEQGDRLMLEVVSSTELKVTKEDAPA